MGSQTRKVRFNTFQRRKVSNHFQLRGILISQCSVSVFLQKNSEEESLVIESKKTKVKEIMKTTRSIEDGEVERPICKFNDASIRISFTRKVYGLVFAQLAVILAFVVAFSIDEFNQHFAKVNLWFSLVGSFLVGLLLFFLLACSSTVRRSHPFNLISLTTLSICEGWFIGALCSFLPGNLPTIGFGLAAAVVFGLTILTCSCKGLNFWWSLLTLFLLLATLTPALAFAFKTDDYENLFWIALGVFSFGLFLIVDLYRMTEGYFWNYTFDQEEYILGALVILIDIMDCVIQLLRVLYFCCMIFDSC